MAIDKEFLDILCCPDTKTDLKILDEEHIGEINSQISLGTVKFKDGKVVDKPLQEALITVDDKMIYRVDDEIPIMLIEKGIPTAQLESFK
jgi:uncharacterized protein YbaR (Trm112 family)